MAYNTAIKAAIDAAIYDNVNQEITGAVLNGVLKAMVDAASEGFQFAGIAEPAMNPGTPNGKIYYMAFEGGNYQYFGNNDLPDNHINFLFWNGASWAIEYPVDLRAFLSENNTFAGNNTFSAELKVAFESLIDLNSDESLQDMLNALMPRVLTAVENHIATFDAYGRAKDSGVSVDDLAKKDGISEKLVSGSARGLLSPSAIEELFLFQRTANGAGGTGAAVFQSIKGNSIVWNQFYNPARFNTTYSSLNVATSEVTPNGIHLTGVGDGTSRYVNLNYYPNTNEVHLIQGHKYYIADKGAPSSFQLILVYSLTRNVQNNEEIITWTAATPDVSVLRYVTSVNGAYDVTLKPQIIDLTLLGLENLTIAQLKAFYPELFYGYNPGAIKNNCATGMVTDGFNQWDEDAFVSAGSLWARHYISALPNTEYNFTAPRGTYPLISFFDADKVQIGATLTLTDVSTAGHAVFTTPAGCNYIRFNMSNSYGTTYNNNICINLSGSRNGQYEPHWSDTTALPITTATGKLNGAGESVVITPDGMAGVGGVFDRGIVEKGLWTKTEKRMGRINLGDLDWTYDSGYQRFTSSPFDILVVSPRTLTALLCAKYTTVTSGGGVPPAGSTGIIYNGGNNVVIHDTAYTDGTLFKASLDGVYLEYQLATPGEYILDTPVPVVARVDENGTQTILPQGVDESGVPMTAPFKASIQYPVKLGVAPIGQQSLVNLLERMKSAGKIASYTMVWDAAAGVYDFTIS